MISKRYHLKLFYGTNVPGATGGTVAMFIVRVILFMMSRQAGSVDTTSVVDTSTDATSGRRPPHRMKTPDLSPGDMGYRHPDGHADGGVTREEMVKLFGNALRVR